MRAQLDVIVEAQEHRSNELSYKIEAEVSPISRQNSERASYKLSPGCRFVWSLRTCNQESIKMIGVGFDMPWRLRTRIIPPAHYTDKQDKHTDIASEAFLFNVE